MLTHLLKIFGIGAFVAMALGSATAEDRRQQMANQCYAYGFKSNTAAFSQCLMQLDQKNQAASARSEQCAVYAQYQYAGPKYDACMAVAR
jgi:hypothetical protein